ncbi:hypothetical protein [Flavobacterium sp.]|uniref:hypothetical protein n=1 Tax=Flavobacterium sp. TaxID=239 RepID=UPI002B4B4C07|nr:hypothetical protein [Flavobacterium sp.]HLF52910.1 hypothetical protein [Flavobacterium sp.]
MIIINNNSILRSPPKLLHPDQIIVFNAIRYSVDICEVTFNRLEKNLFDFTFTPQNGNFISLIFSDVWTIINNATILKKVIKKHFNIDDNDPLLIGLKKLEGLRNSNQHIEERIDQIKSFDDLPPIYGVISWLSKEDENSDEGMLSIIYSGTINKDKVTHPVNPADKINRKKVNDIKFTGIERKGRTDIFFETSVYINKIMDDIKNIIDHFEIKISEDLKDVDYSDRHKSDIIIQLKTKEVIV